MWDEQGPCGLDESLLFSMPVLSQCFLAFLDLGRAFSSVTRYQVLLKPGVLRPTAPLSHLGQEQERIKATSVKERRAGVPGCVAPRARSRLQALSTPGFLVSSPHLPRPLPPDTTVAWRRRARALGEKVSKPRFSALIGRARRVLGAAANGRRGQQGADGAGTAVGPCWPAPCRGSSSPGRGK